VSARRDPRREPWRTITGWSFLAGGAELTGWADYLMYAGLTCATASCAASKAKHGLLLATASVVDHLVETTEGGFIPGCQVAKDASRGYADGKFGRVPGRSRISKSQ